MAEISQDWGKNLDSGACIQVYSARTQGKENCDLIKTEPNLPASIERSLRRWG